MTPDEEREVRRAKYRAKERARAGRALDRLLDWRGVEGVYDQGWRDGYEASRLHHNGHYGVSVEPHRFIYGGDFLCVTCGALASDVRHRTED